MTIDASSTTGSVPSPEPRPYHVSLVALPDAAVSTIAGIYDVMNSVGLTAHTAATPTFHVEIVGEAEGTLELASGLPFKVQRALKSIESSDIVIVPSVFLRADTWEKHRYPQVVDWVRTMHLRGALICSACSGVFLLAETGLFDGREATVHFGYARAFAASYPAVTIHPERPLVISGLREELVSSGASMSWHDLVLYLIARYAGAWVAQEIARMFALQWHQDGLTPFMIFEGNTDHGDAEIDRKSVV